MHLTYKTIFGMTLENHQITLKDKALIYNITI